MARIRVLLDIEERDLEQFVKPSGVCLPTRVIRLKKVGLDVYVLQHGENPLAERRTPKYNRHPDGVYPPNEYVSIGPLSETFNGD